MKSAPPEEGGCNAAFPLVLPYKKVDVHFFASVRFPFPGALLFFEHPLSFIPDFLQSIFYVTTSRKAAQEIDTIT